MPTLIKDISQGASQSCRVDPVYGLAYYGTRVFLVKDMADGSANESASAIARSLQNVGLPQIRSNPFPEDLTIAPRSVITNYRGTVGPTDDSVFLFADYDFFPLPTSPALFTVTDDTGVQQVQTQLFPGTYESLSFTWRDPLYPVGGPPEEDTATLSFEIPLRRLVLSGPVANRDLGAYRTKVGYVNEEAWRDLPRGYWKFVGLRTVQDTAGQLLAGATSFTQPVDGPIDRASVANAINNPDMRFPTTITIESKCIEPWSQQAAFRLPSTGKFISVPQKEVNAARAAPYQYGIQRYNGLLVAGLHPLTSFSALFGS